MHKNLPALLLACLALLLGAPFAHAQTAAGQAAQVKVGKADNTPGPSLPALATPVTATPAVEESSLVHTDQLPDTQWPKFLQKHGNLPAALTAWQQVAYQSAGTERLWALLNAAHLQTQLNQPAAAAETLRHLLNQPAAQPRRAELLTRLLHVTPLEQHAPLLADLRTMPASPWQQVALLRSAAHAVVHGQTPTFEGLTALAPQAVQKLAAARTTQQALGQQRALQALALGVLPGVGHMWLGQGAAGALTLLLWAMLGWAFLSACRHRHFAYACVFVWPWVALWAHSLAGSWHLAQTQANATLRAELTTALAPLNTLQTQLLTTPPTTP